MKPATRRPLLAAWSLIGLLVPSLGFPATGTTLPLNDYPDSIDAALERYPSLDVNGTALDLEALAADLGIDLVPGPIESRPRPTGEESQAFKDVRNELRDYLDDELTRTDTGIAPAPTSLAAFLETRRETLVALRTRLVEGDPPRWERRIEELRAAPIPNLLGHIALQRLLLAAALGRAADGDSDDALSFLDASWRLNLALRDEPLLITQLVAVAVVRLEAGTLRRLDRVPDLWIERLGEHDYRTSLMNSLWIEGWFWREADVGSYPHSERGWGSRVVLALGRSYSRLCLDDAAERWKRILESVADRTSLCDADVEALEREFIESTPWWNRIAGIGYPNLLGSFRRIARIELDLEMTSRILEIRSHRRRTGAPPASLPHDLSTACPDARWRYERRGDAGFVLELDRAMHWEDQRGTILPTRFAADAAE